jgi:integrase
MGPLLRGSHRSGRLMHGGMNRIAITVRVWVLGEALGIEGLSAHDCRHYWATAALASGTQIDRLQDAGSWASRPCRYVMPRRRALLIRG